MDLNSLDFQQARIKQVLFKSQLRSMLYGVKEVEQAFFTLRGNPLGEWLHSVASVKYGSRPEVRELERELSAMLGTAQGLVAQYGRGKIEEARAGLQQIDVHNNKLTGLLQSLEQKVG